MPMRVLVTGANGNTGRAVVVELAYKKLLRHPGPPVSISHPDGPSLSDLADSSLQLQASFPSGHMTRTVIVYGLLAFIVHRLAPAGEGDVEVLDVDERRLAHAAASIARAAECPLPGSCIRHATACVPCPTPSAGTFCEQTASACGQRV